MAALYTNENFPQNTVKELRQLGHNVLTSYEAGNSGKGVPDEEVLQFAIKTQRILVTLNRRHFIRLHATTPNHAGIIVCTFDTDYIALAHRIYVVLDSQSEIKGQLIRVNRPNQV